MQKRCVPISTNRPFSTSRRTRTRIFSSITDICLEGRTDYAGIFFSEEAEGLEPSSQFLDILVFKTSSSSSRITSIIAENKGIEPLHPIKDGFGLANRHIATLSILHNYNTFFCFCQVDKIGFEPTQPEGTWFTAKHDSPTSPLILDNHSSYTKVRN